MPRSLKITLCAAAVIAGVLAVVTVAAFFLVDVDARKSGLEAAASQALGMDVTVGGRAGIRLFPRLHVTLDDVHVRNGGVDIAAAARVDLGIAVLPLFYLQVRPAKIEVERYRISIERGVDGKFNFESPTEPRATLPALNLEDVSFSDGTLLYANKEDGGGLEAAHCSLDVGRLQYPGGKRADFLRKVAMTGKLRCRDMRTEDLAVSDLESPVNGKDGIFEFAPVTMLAFGAQGSGRLRVDRSGPIPRVSVHYVLRKFPIEAFVKTLSPEKVAHGPMDFSASLVMQGTSMSELRRTADGEVSLGGEDLTLDGRDLDEDLSKYESSQAFNLVDVGALFLVGPIGLAVTKGYDFTNLLKGSGGSTRISRLVSTWQVERGVARAKDVALATKENRVALHGRLDFVNKEFDDVTVALIDARGCPKVRQKIHGPFGKPVVDKPNVLQSLAGPAITLLKQARDLVSSEPCKPFYEGSVQPPE